MTDYVITEEQLHRLAYFADMLDVESEIRSRPLSEAISSQRHGCLTCFDHTCPVWQTADQNCWKSEKDALKCQTCGGVVTHPMCDKCYWNNIENTCQEALKAEREKIIKWLEDNWQFFEIEDPDDSQHAQIDGYDMLIESLRSSD